MERIHSQFVPGALLIVIILRFQECAAARRRIANSAGMHLRASALAGQEYKWLENRTAASINAHLHVSTGSQTLSGALFHSSAGPVAAFWNMRYGLAKRWKLGTVTDVTCGSAHSSVPTSCTHSSPPSKLWKVVTGTNPLLGNPRERCVQYLLVLGRLGVEDCLFLDLYTAALTSDNEIDTAANLPIILWLHGGGFLMGDKYQNGIHDARQMAAAKRVVVAAVNYRLGVFGFLSHPGLIENNFGVHDQFLAMSWVQKHAAAFGGDREALTIIGQSAGAISICAHLASPLSRPLFKAAVLQSGNCDGGFFWTPVSKAKEQGQIYLRAVFGRIRGCNSQKGEDRALENASDYGGKGDFQSWKSTQSNCDNVPQLSELSSLCGNLFEIPPDESRKAEYLRVRLPFAGIGPCQLDYSGCSDPSNDTEAFRHVGDDGSRLDQILFSCAELLDPSFLWVNRFGLGEALPPPAKGMWGSLTSIVDMKYIFGIDITGLPAELPWRPAFGYAPGQGQSHLEADAGPAHVTGLVQHPLRYLQGGPRLGKPVIFGFTRDEGSIFVPVLTAFVAEIAQLKKSAKNLTVDDLEAGGLDIGGKVVCRHAPSACQALMERLRKKRRYTNGVRIMSKLITDYLFVCPQLRSARALTEQALPGHWIEALDRNGHSAYYDNKSMTLQSTFPEGATRAWVYDYHVDNVLTERFGIRQSAGAFHMSDVFSDFDGGDLPWIMSLGITWNRANKEIASVFEDSLSHLSSCTRCLPDGWYPLSSAKRKEDVRRYALNQDGEAVVEQVPYQEAVYDAHHCDMWDYFHDLETENLMHGL